MKTNWILKGMGMGAMMLLLMFLFGYVTMLLWNWLMPALFGLTTVTFWQAVGLMLLGRALTGTSGNWGRGRPGWKQRMKRKFEKMSPEEREKWRQQMEHRCGSDWKLEKAGVSAVQATQKPDEDQAEG